MRETQSIPAGLDRARRAAVAIDAETVAQRLDDVTVETQRLADRELVPFDGREIRERSTEPGAEFFARRLRRARAVDQFRGSGPVQRRKSECWISS
jgi:hypothetical protein